MTADTEQASVVFVLAGPQQAWSPLERRAHRPSQDHPTKSGVIGMVANALGRDRSDDIDDLAALRLAVRADRPGHLESDYHTAGSGRFPLLPGEALTDRATARVAADGRIPERVYAAPKNIRRDGAGALTGKRDAALLTRDHYLVDAVFTIALSGPRPLIEQIHAALEAPARTLFLGRRAYPLSRPPQPQLHTTTDPRDALEATAPAVHPAPAQLTIWAETAPITSRDQGARIVADQPTRFDRRRHQPRVETRTTTGSSGPAAAAMSLAATLDFFTPEDHP